MEPFYVARGDKQSGPMTTAELRTARVRPTDRVRRGEDGPWLDLGTMISIDRRARTDLEDALDPDEPPPEPWELRHVLEWTWPVMLLFVDSVWLVTAAEMNVMNASWTGVLILVGAIGLATFGLLRRRPWGWTLATLVTAACFAWMLAPLVVSANASLMLWAVLNLVATAVLVARRPRGVALDWAPGVRRVLLAFSSDPATEARPVGLRSERSGLALALAGVALFVVLILGGVAVYHRLRYPDHDIAFGLVPRGTDGWARAARLGVYGLMVVIAIALAVLDGGALRGLGITAGHGWKRAAWTGARLFLVLTVLLFGGRWVLRAAEAVEARTAAPAAVQNAEPTATARIRATVGEVIERASRRRAASPDRLWIVIVALLIGPLCEEVFFRGLLFGSLRRRWPFWAAAGASTLVFVLAHGPVAGWSLATVVFWLEIGAGGLMAAYAYERTGTLAAPLVMHVLFNASQTVSRLSIA